MSLFLIIFCCICIQSISCFTSHCITSKYLLHSKNQHHHISTIRYGTRITSEENDFETDTENKDWREWTSDPIIIQEKLEEDIIKLEARMVKDEKRYESIVEFVYKVLPIFSIFLSIAGISFQVFVLYPWHEELSYEFKSLETSIIALDDKIENKKFTDFNKLKRPTDEYAKTIESKQAGPVISNILPFFKELNDLRADRKVVN